MTSKAFMWQKIKNVIYKTGKATSYFADEKYYILFDTTNVCNLKCTFCSRRNDKAVRMTTQEFDGILGKIHNHISGIQLSCAWEYSIANNAASLINILGKYKLQESTIYTNGNILTDDVAKALIDVRLHDFVFSIGEAKKETYEKLRQGGAFEKVISNIKKLDILKKKRNSTFPRVCTNLTLVNSNIGELIDFIDLAQNLGVQRIIGRHLILNEGLDMTNEIVKDKTQANEIIDVAEAKAVSYGMTFSIPRYTPPAPKSCKAPWQQLYISSNGDVSVCPRIHRYETMGNLLEDSFISIIKSDKMKKLKDQFTHREFNNPVCKICMENRETEQAINQGF